MTRNRFATFAWMVVAYNILVILWGAFVRASGSGAGCGSHWPLCNGEVVPVNPSIERVIEFTHRTMSGIALLLVVILIVWAFRAYPWGRVRYGALASGAFILIEALIGAALVLLALVGTNDSLARAVVIALHLANTFLLLAALSLTAWWAAGGSALRLDGRNRQVTLLAIALVGLALVAVAGAVTALGDTLFPSSSLAEGLAQDVSPTAHFLTQLRVYHPILALVVGSYLLVLAGFWSGEHGSTTARLSVILRAFIVVQWLAGALNIFLLAPTFMQLLHLFIADVLWITLVLYSASLLSAEAQPAPARIPRASPAE
jgi:heme A synthase